MVTKDENGLNVGKGFMKRIFPPTWMRYGRNFFHAALFSRISEKRSASCTVQHNPSGILRQLLLLLAWWL